MLQAFIIVWREGFEAFLIVAITFAYLQRTGRLNLLPAVYQGVAASVVTSALAGFLMLKQANESLWEGIFGLVAAVLVSWLVIHMWRTAPRLKQDMEKHLSEVSVRPSAAAYGGVFLFTVFMITREGMETALLLIQIHSAHVVAGSLLGLLAAAAMSCLWIWCGHLVNLKIFFQATAVFLMLCVAQILLYTFHEFTEVGIFPYSETLHVATEPFSPDGLYGRWFSVGMLLLCGGWLIGAWIVDRLSRKRPH